MVVVVSVVIVVYVVVVVEPSVVLAEAVVGVVLFRFMSIGSKVVMPPLHAVSKHKSTAPTPAMPPENRCCFTVTLP